MSLTLSKFFTVPFNWRGSKPYEKTSAKSVGDSLKETTVVLTLLYTDKKKPLPTENPF